MSNYCGYLPLKLNLKASLDNLFQKHINDDENLEENLSTLFKFIRKNDVILGKYKDQIQVIIIEQDSYRARNIIPIIYDNEHYQCFISVEKDWVEINSVNDETIIAKFHQLAEDKAEELDKTFVNSADKLINNYFHKK